MTVRIIDIRESTRPISFQPYGGFPDDARVQDGYVTMQALG
jgi:hypothetical protein